MNNVMWCMNNEIAGAYLLYHWSQLGQQSLQSQNSSAKSATNCNEEFYIGTFTLSKTQELYVAESIHKLLFVCVCVCTATVCA